MIITYSRCCGGPASSERKSSLIARVKRSVAISELTAIRCAASGALCAREKMEQKELSYSANNKRNRRTRTKRKTSRRRKEWKVNQQLFSVSKVSSCGGERARVHRHSPPGAGGAAAETSTREEKRNKRDKNGM